MTGVPEDPRGGGGGHSDTKWVPTAKQTRMQSGVGKHQNRGVVNSFEGQKEGEGGQLQTVNLIRV